MTQVTQQVMTHFLHGFRIGSDKEQRDADLSRILSEHALAPFTERDVTTTSSASNGFVNMLAALVAYTWQEQHPSLHFQPEERTLLLAAAA